MSAPIIAWLLSADMVADECGVLEVTSFGKRYIRDAAQLATVSISEKAKQ